MGRCPFWHADYGFFSDSSKCHVTRQEKAYNNVCNEHPEKCKLAVQAKSNMCEYWVLNSKGPENNRCAAFTPPVLLSKEPECHNGKNCPFNPSKCLIHQEAITRRKQALRNRMDKR